MTHTPTDSPPPPHPQPPTHTQLLWTFSIYLEAVAILPQLIVLQRYSVVENLTGHYVFFLGAYRGLYILNWVRACLCCGSCGGAGVCLQASVDAPAGVGGSWCIYIPTQTPTLTLP